MKTEANYRHHQGAAACAQKSADNSCQDTGDEINYVEEYSHISILFEILMHKDCGLADLTQASSLAGGLVSMYRQKISFTP